MTQKSQSRIIRTFVYSAALVSALVTVGITAYILVRGLPNLEPSIFSVKYTSENASLFPALVNTITVVILTLLLSLPVGIGAAIYLTEYAKNKSPSVKIFRMAAETLSGIPSIVYGLFGYLFFVTALGWGYSLFAGCATLSIMILPVIIRTSEEALLAVPVSYREASFGLGAGKLRTVFKCVLPSAANGIVSGIVLGSGRVVGETAALIYTAGNVASVPKSLTGSGRTLAVHLYALWNEGLSTNQAYATAVILLLVAALVNAASGAVEKGIKKEK